MALYDKLFEAALHRYDDQVQTPTCVTVRVNISRSSWFVCSGGSGISFEDNFEDQDIQVGDDCDDFMGVGFDSVPKSLDTTSQHTKIFYLAYTCRKKFVPRTTARLTQQRVILTGLSVYFKVAYVVFRNDQLVGLPNKWDCGYCGADILLDSGFENIQSTFCQKHCQDFEVH